MALTREVILKYTIDGSGAKKGAEQIDKSLDKTKKSASGFSKALSAIGPQIAAAFTVGAIVSFGKKAVETFAQFEKSLASLQGILGVTTKELKFFKDAALDLAKTSTRSANEIVKAFELVGSAKPELLANSQALKEVTERVLTLSEASGLDLVQSTQAVTGALNQFGEGAESADRFINALAAGAQAGSAAIPLLSASIDVAGTVMSDANVSFEEGVGLVEVLAEKSIVGAQAGTNLRNILLKLQVAGIGFASGVFDINDALDELAAKNLNAEEATKLFGLESITAGNILIANRDRFKELTEAVTGTNTAYEQAAINNATFDATTKRLSNSIDVLFIQLGEKIAPAIGKLAELLTGLANNMDAVQDEFKGVNKLAEQLGSLLGPIIEFSGGLIEKIGELTGEFSVFKAALTAIVPGFSALQTNLENTAGFFTGVGQAVDILSGKYDGHTDDVKEVELAYADAGIQFGLWNEELVESSKTIENWRKGMAKGIAVAFDTVEVTEELTEETDILTGSLAFYQAKIAAIAEELRTETIPGTDAYTRKQGELTAATNDLNDALIRARGPILSPETIQSMETGAGLMGDIADNSERVAINTPAAAASVDGLGQSLEQVNTILEFTSEFIGVLDQAFQVSFDNQINRLDKEREARINAAEGSATKIASINKEFDKKKLDIERKQFIRNKATAISQAAINTALGITRVLADVPKFDFGIATGILVALTAALGAAEIAIIAARTFSKGEVNIDGPGSGTSDSINARLSRGESVITAQRTQQYLPALQAIHTGRISPDMMNAFVNSGGRLTINSGSAFSDTGIIGATDRQTKQLIRALDRNSRVNSGRGGYYSDKKRLING